MTSLFQIFARFFQGSALCISPGQFLYISNPPFFFLLENRCKFLHPSYLLCLNTSVGQDFPYSFIIN